MKTGLKIVALGLLGISGLVCVVTSNIWLMDTIKQRSMTGTPEDFLLVVALLVLGLVVIFGPMFIALYIAYRINQREGGHPEDLLLDLFPWKQEGNKSSQKQK